MERIRISCHDIITTRKTHFNHQFVTKMVMLSVAWLVFLGVYEFFSDPEVNAKLIEFLKKFEKNNRVPFYYYVFINGFWIFAITLSVMSVIILFKKNSSLLELRVYNDGIGFYNNEDKSEQFIDYKHFYFNYNQDRSGFRIVYRVALNRCEEYYWNQFVWPDKLQTNLLRYGNWQ